MEDETIEQQSIKQKKIAFAQSEHIEAVIAIMRDVAKHTKLVGDSEFETLVNAITMDSQAELMLQFINQIDFIKQGGLVSTEL